MNSLHFETPMMRQYLEIKKRYHDCILLFRLGDFYEMFLDDAKIGSEVLGITLTSRARGKDGRIPMCGIPYHALDSYLGKLTKAGYKVAICEQLEDAGTAKDMVRRDVVRVVTPGTVLDEKNLLRKENNFVLAFQIVSKELGLAYADISTGEFYVKQISWANLEKDLAAEVLQIRPVEIISSDGLYNRPEVLRALRVIPETNIFPYHQWDLRVRDARKILRDHFGVASFEGFGIGAKKYNLALQAAAVLLSYLKETQKGPVEHIKKISPYRLDKYLHLDAATIANLELFSTIREQNTKASLVGVIDRTRTAMGGRKLRHWLLKPLREIREINRRLDGIEMLLSETGKREKIAEILSRILDIERLLSRISVGTANPRDMEGLKISLQNCLYLAKFLHEKFPRLDGAFLKKLTEIEEPIRLVVGLLEAKIKPDPPAVLADGGYIREGVSPDLDEYRRMLSGSREWLKKFEERERQRSGISSLKVGVNKVFGFYIEVSKANLSQVPPDYIRKQTLANAERYIVPELKQREEMALEAEEKIRVLEQKIFFEVAGEIMKHAEPIQQMARAAARVDVLVSLAEVAQHYRYSRPQLVDGGALCIKNGRHPVIETLEATEIFVPNDTEMNFSDSQILLITGPNMAGKSTYIRQVALITLLAQMGSYVPADSAQIPVRDQIFTRIGASDSITLGQSTFLVEMMETANILNNCTPKSLVIFDEIGRGTSTFDGMSLAWAVVEYLLKHKSKAALVLFATHYHELTVLARKYPRIKNLQMAVKREGEEIIFLHKVIEGGAWQSYGIEVAKLAGLPSWVVRRAQEVLHRLKHEEKKLSVRKKNGRKGREQISLLE